MSPNSHNCKQRKNYGWIYLLLIVSILMNGCVTNKKVSYLQVYPESDLSGEYTPPDTYKIQPNDNLYIRVATLDPRFSTFFNPTVEGGARMDENSADLLSYRVEEDGNVEIPYIGSVQVAGMTLLEAKLTMEEIFSDYVNDAAITIRLVNNYVSILGYVNNPGLYPIYKQRLNVFQAISMAGDIALYGDRYMVSIVRQTLDGSVIKEFDITDEKIIDSEFYHVLPNDVIYVKPMKGRFFGLSEFPYALFFSTVATTISIIVLIQNTAALNNR